MEITAIILAGGRSLRLGRNKALEAIGSKSLIEYIIERLGPLTNRFLIATSQGQSDLPVICDAEVLVDIYPGKGPLGGIYTGLLASGTSHNVVVASDMPFINIELLRYMIELSLDFDVVIPRLREGMIEPLHAVYSKNCLNNMKTQLEQGYLKISHLLNTVRVRYVEIAECQKFDPQLLTFFNINSQSDLDKAIALAAESKH